LLNFKFCSESNGIKEYCSLLSKPPKWEVFYIGEVMRIKLVSIKEDITNLFDYPTEIMTKEPDGNDRPFLLILKLKYKNNIHNFALPFRSNIQVNKNTKGLYFKLPPRPTTKPYHAHGLHYIKIFPVDIEYCNKFTFKETKYNILLQEIIDRNISRIVNEAQEYLNNYENGERPNYCTDIDKMIITLEQNKLHKQSIIELVEKQIDKTNQEKEA
jgi:hypothetical protein